MIAVCLVAGPLRGAILNAALIPPASRFAERWDAIDGHLRTARGREVVVEAPVTVGGLVFITPHPLHPGNRVIADYYGLKSVRSR